MANAFGAWGLLPIVAPLFAYVAARLGRLAFGKEGARGADRAVASVLLGFAVVAVTVRALSFVHAIETRWLFGCLVVSAALLSRAPRHAAVFASRERARALIRESSAAVLLVAALALVLAVLAARWLPVWQWDSLGYHLPFVHFTLAARSVDGVPRGLEYVASYPHDVELFFVALRACLPDDRLIDLGQVPFGIGGAVITAALARRAGASAATSVAAGALWLLVPAVFLQLPTDYVDVATATFFLGAVYFVLAPATRPSIVLTGVGLGLFVGSKPSAPLPAAIVFTLLVVSGARARLGVAVLAALLVMLVLGGESYATNLVDHQNPIWPVRVDVGPIHLPGEHPLAELLAAGANAPRLTGVLPWRLVRSLFSFTSTPVFDMRVGGFGPVVACALPLAIAWLVRQRSVLHWVAFGSALVSPDAAVARYVLAFPALILAASAATAPPRSRVARMAVGLTVAILGAGQLVYAAPGLSGEGPSLWTYASMSDAERAVAVGADGAPLAIAAARSRVGPGEAFAFDDHMDLSDQAWDMGQTYRVVFLAPRARRSDADDAISDQIARARVRVMAVGDGAPAGRWALGHPEAFERLFDLPSCRKGTCSVFVRR